MINDIQYDFHGFRPDSEFQNFIASVAEKIHLSAPSDSAIKLIIRKSKNAIKASCRIASLAGTFAADAMSDSPVRAIRLIDKKISDQLDRWKARRFKSEHNLTRYH